MLAGIDADRAKREVSRTASRLVWARDWRRSRRVSLLRIRVHSFLRGGSRVSGAGAVRWLPGTTPAVAALMAPPA